MEERILTLLGDAVAEIFYKVSTEYDIICGDCPPDIEWMLERGKEDLAEVMYTALEVQLTQHFI